MSRIRLTNVVPLTILRRPNAPYVTLFFRLLARRFLRLRLLLSEYVSQGDVDFLVVLAGLGLRRAAPAAIQEDARRRHARGWWHGVLADQPGEHLDA